MTLAGIGGQIDEADRLPIAHGRRPGTLCDLIFKGDFATREEGQLPGLGRQGPTGAPRPFPPEAISEQIARLRRRFGRNLREFVEEKGPMMVAGGQRLKTIFGCAPRADLVLWRAEDGGGN